MGSEVDSVYVGPIKEKNQSAFFGEEYLVDRIDENGVISRRLTNKLKINVRLGHTPYVLREILFSPLHPQELYVEKKFVQILRRNRQTETEQFVQYEMKPRSCDLDELWLHLLSISIKQIEDEAREEEDEEENKIIRIKHLVIQRFIELSLPILYKIALTLHHFHEQGMVHGDLRESNIYGFVQFKSNGDDETVQEVDVKLAGFGFSRPQGFALSDEICPPHCRAPELVTPKEIKQQKRKIIVKTFHTQDIFSYGGLIRNLLKFTTYLLESDTIEHVQLKDWNTTLVNKQNIQAIINPTWLQSLHSSSSIMSETLIDQWQKFNEIKVKNPSRFATWFCKREEIQQELLDEIKQELKSWKPLSFEDLKETIIRDRESVHVFEELTRFVIQLKTHEMFHTEDDDGLFSTFSNIRSNMPNIPSTSGEVLFAYIELFRPSILDLKSKEYSNFNKARWDNVRDIIIKHKISSTRNPMEIVESWRNTVQAWHAECQKDSMNFTKFLNWLDIVHPGSLPEDYQEVIHHLRVETLKNLPVRRVTLPTSSFVFNPAENELGAVINSSTYKTLVKCMNSCLEDDQILRPTAQQIAVSLRKCTKRTDSPIQRDTLEEYGFLRRCVGDQIRTWFPTEEVAKIVFGSKTLQEEFQQKFGIHSDKMWANGEMDIYRLSLMLHVCLEAKQVTIEKSLLLKSKSSLLFLSCYIIAVKILLTHNTALKLFEEWKDFYTSWVKSIQRSDSSLNNKKISEMSLLLMLENFLILWVGNGLVTMPSVLDLSVADEGWIHEKWTSWLKSKKYIG
jgi:serine/threonine protein kinase